MKKLFSGSTKVQIENLETSNVVHEYDCVCPDFYIDETERVLDVRIGDHQKKVETQTAKNRSKNSKI